MNYDSNISRDETSTVANEYREKPNLIHKIVVFTNLRSSPAFYPSNSMKKTKTMLHPKLTYYRDQIAYFYREYTNGSVGYDKFTPKQWETFRVDMDGFRKMRAVLESLPEKLTEEEVETAVQRLRELNFV